MRKWILAPIIVIMAFFISEFSEATFEGVFLGDSDLYENLQLQSGKLLKDIVVLPDEKYDKIKASEIINRLDHLPYSVLQKIKKNDIKIVLFNGILTDQQSAVHLRGQVPRGYPKSVLWDDVPGIGGSKAVLVKIGHSELGKGHGSVNLEYHELAHSLQRYVYAEAWTAEIGSKWVKEANALFPGWEYILNYEEEYFAESFAYYFLSDETRNTLKNAAPATYAFMNKLK